VTIRVLVVDDSAFIRRAVSRMLAEDPEIAVVGQASNGDEALALVASCSPDVITLDLEMPTVGGLATLRRIMAERPTPVVLLSAHAQADASNTLEALAAGAVDFIDKSAVSPMDVHALGDELIRKVRTAARSRLSAMTTRPPPASLDELTSSASSVSVIVLGASTGGPPAIQLILGRLPADFPIPMLVIQHMPPRFTRAFADRLGTGCALRVKEAAQGDVIAAGTILVAPGGRQLELKRTDARFEVALKQGASLDLHVPSLDATAGSAASILGDGVCFAVLTGMGVDGVEGARAVRKAGGLVVAQDEESSVLYGMPRAVAQAGLANFVLPLERMADLFIRLARRRLLSQGGPFRSESRPR
jgi:two-component system chemotaxis response regulator CheB